ncbi:hypothetical protein CsSME_00015039 [Camellia sinensis var. sinensis]
MTQPGRGKRVCCLWRSVLASCAVGGTPSSTRSRSSNGGRCRPLPPTITSTTFTTPSSIGGLMNGLNLNNLILIQ